MKPSWRILLFALAVALCQALEVRADDTHRYALFVGQNDGGEGTHRLLYAEEDATRMRDLFERLGSVGAGDGTLLRGPRRDQVLAAVSRLGGRIAQDRRAGLRTVLYFYYSGHADGDGLRLAGTRLGMAELKAALRGAGADLRVVLLDACQSGQATRVKGGTLAPSFLVQVDDGDALTGEVVLTSSASDEASQESDRVGGGYFTHHLMSGMLGAADTSHDGQVSLEEAYAYAYHRTLFETAGSAGGLQHPGFQADLKGHGTLVLTRPSQGQTILVFPAGIEGQFLVFDRNRKLFVAELRLTGQGERRLALPAGKYLIQKRETDHLLTAEVLLTRGVMKQVDLEAMTRTGFEQDFSRGVAEANVSRATRSPVTLSALAGMQVFVHQPPGTELFPSIPLYGFQVAWRHLFGPRWSLTADVAAGTQDTTLDFAAYDIPASYRALVVGVGLSYDWRWGRWSGSIGPHLSTLYVRRDFPGSEQPYQDFVNVMPGVAADLGVTLFGSLSVGVIGRGHYLYYYADGDDSSIGTGEALVRVSLAF